MDCNRILSRINIMIVSWKFIICATIKIVDYGYGESVKVFEVKDLISFKDIINSPGSTVKYVIRRKGG